MISPFPVYWRDEDFHFNWHYHLSTSHTLWQTLLFLSVFKFQLRCHLHSVLKLTSAVHFQCLYIKLHTLLALLLFLVFELWLHFNNNLKCLFKAYLLCIFNNFKYFNCKISAVSTAQSRIGPFSRWFISVLPFLSCFKCMYLFILTSRWPCTLFVVWFDAACLSICKP